MSVAHELGLRVIARKVRAALVRLRAGSDEMLVLSTLAAGRALAETRRRLGGSRRRPDNPRHVVVLSYFAPPWPVVHGTQRVGKFIKYLARTGWRVTLVTTDPPVPGRDNSTEAFPASVTTVRIPERAVAPAIRGRALVVPDDYVGWTLDAVRAVRSIVSRGRPGLLFATAPPYTNVVAATLCADLFDLPVVLDFRDPWSKQDTVWKFTSPALRAVTEVVEALVLRAAARIVIASPIEFADDNFRPQPSAVRGRITSIPNGYDEEDFATGAPAPSGPGRFVVSYVGTIYDDETFRNLLRPLEIWHARHPADFDDVVFECAGAGLHRFAQPGPVRPYLVDHGYLPHRQAVALRMRSSVQLFTLPGVIRPHILSGKIYEMLRAGPPIVAITRGHGPVERLVERVGAGVVADPERPEATAEVLRDFYLRWRSGEPFGRADLAAIRPFSRETLARSLSNLFEDVLAEDQGRQGRASSRASKASSRSPVVDTR